MQSNHKPFRLHKQPRFLCIQSCCSHNLAQISILLNDYPANKILERKKDVPNKQTGPSNFCGPSGGKMSWALSRLFEFCTRDSFTQSPGRIACAATASLPIIYNQFNLISNWRHRSLSVALPSPPYTERQPWLRPSVLLRSCCCRT